MREPGGETEGVLKHTPSGWRWTRKGSKSTPQRRPGTIGRRSFLKGAGGAAALTVGSAVVLGGAGVVELIVNSLEGGPPSPNEVFTGTLRVTKDARVRTSPDVPQKGSTNDNLVNWSDIQEINGKKTSGMESFDILNPLALHGYNPSGGRDKSPWIVINAKVGDKILGADSKSLYIYVGGNNPYVDTIEPGGFIPAQKQNDLWFANGNGKHLVPNEIGVTTINTENNLISTS